MPGSLITQLLMKCATALMGKGKRRASRAVPPYRITQVPESDPTSASQQHFSSSRENAVSYPFSALISHPCHSFYSSVFASFYCDFRLASKTQTPRKKKLKRWGGRTILQGLLWERALHFQREMEESSMLDALDANLRMGTSLSALVVHCGSHRDF